MGGTFFMDVPEDPNISTLLKLLKVSSLLRVSGVVFKICCSLLTYGDVAEVFELQVAEVRSHLVGFHVVKNQRHLPLLHRGRGSLGRIHVRASGQKQRPEMGQIDGCPIYRTTA